MILLIKGLVNAEDASGSQFLLEVLVGTKVVACFVSRLADLFAPMVGVFHLSTEFFDIDGVAKPEDLLLILLVVYQFDLDHLRTSTEKHLGNVCAAIASIEPELYNPRRFERGSRSRYLARS